MKNELDTTWIVVMDSSVARFYRLTQDVNGSLGLAPATDMMESALQRHARDLKSDKPGRSYRAGDAAARHGIEPSHDYHKLEKHEFVRAVAAALKSAHDANTYSRLVIVTPNRSLGELRSELADPVKKAVWREIPKDLVKLSDHDLWLRLEPELQEELGSAA